MQHGLERSSGRDGLICWSSWYDSSGWAGRQKGFSGGESRPAVMVGCSRRRFASPRSYPAYVQRMLDEAREQGHLYP
jgi:hypothetical protein